MLTNFIGSMVRFEMIQPSLQRRVFSAGSDSYADFNLIGIVQHEGVVLEADERHEVGGYSIFCVPSKSHAKIIIPAGAQVWLLGGREELLTLVIGSDQDSKKIDLLLRQWSVTKCEKQTIEQDFLPILKVLHKEISDERKRSQSVVSSIFRILLISIYRLNAIEMRGATHSPDELILQKFRQLVELEFKRRRTVSFFCDELHVTYDRLHAVCQRTLGKTPLQLVHSRVLIEAVSRLKKSADSIQTIANELGYNDASQFSHFFKKEAGVSPFQFKKSLREKHLSNRNLPQIDFSDWP